MGTSRGTTGHDEATNEGQPDAFARSARSRQKPPAQLWLTVVRHAAAGQKTQLARRKQQEGGGQAQGRPLANRAE